MRRAERRERRWLGFSLPTVGVGLKSSRLGIGDIDLTGRKQKVNVTGGRVALELLSKGWYSSLFVLTSTIFHLLPLLLYSALHILNQVKSLINQVIILTI